MRPCASCATLVPATICPTCGARLRGTSTAVKAAAITLMGLTLGACDGGGGQTVALYGVAVGQDADGDGWDEYNDCDDDDDTIYPGADETPGDGVDSNCDGEDDT